MGRGRILAALLIGVALVAACSGGDDEASDGVTRRPGATTAPAATVTATAVGGPDQRTLRVPEWAAEVCAAVDAFSTAAAASRSDVDPATLSVEQRVARFRELTPPFIAVFEELEATLSGIRPPAEVQAFHDALIAEAREAAAAYEQQLEAMAVVRSEADIAAANAATLAVLVRTEQTVVDAAITLSSDALGELYTATRCGRLIDRLGIEPFPAPTAVPGPLTFHRSATARAT